ncbi:MAG: alpha-amylase family protein [Chloroflexi bacterium]|nr:alpha-amylase family protein [Chloroflexota bacterium]
MIDLWYKNAVIYALDVGTFADSNGDGIGDFQGLCNQLPYLAGIGITCVWLLPFYPSPQRDHGYDITDYYGVDPRYGTLGDFVDFMRQADELGIRVIVDLVVNHTSNEHVWFQSARSSPDSPFRDWYVWSKDKPREAESGIVFPGVQKTTWTFDRKASAYYFHRFYDFQPDLNVSNPAVREEIERIMGFWIQLGVTGFRIDAAPFIIEDKGVREPMGPEQYGWLTDFRRFLSWRRGDAIMLAEANVPPKNVLNFFGTGDRMNLLFNFWANMHLFLAVAQEDATILRKTFQQLPPLPPTAQWANFLRNHDEIDLGRLADDERELCFRAFAPEPDMQLYGRGIRRRLAPMLQGDRRRMELMNSLLFTLPGTPVIRYGEEIGMGDFLELPERESIRTPMQWSTGANGGFSSADRRKLIRPVVDSGEYRYERINVAAQRLDPDSFLNWTERAIRARKECPEFGWGEMKFLETDHPAVLAHACSWRGGTVAAVHNFSRATTTVNVKWPAGTKQLLHLYGRRVQDPLPVETGVLDLDGYDCRWLRLDGATASD